MLDPHLELKAYNRELLAKVRQLTTKSGKVRAENVELKQSLVEKETELNVLRKKAKAEPFSAIRMVVVHPEIECPFCHKKIIDPNSMKGVPTGIKKS